MSNAGTLKTADTRRRFDAAADDFDAHDFVHRHTAAGMFDRLLALNAEAATVLDLGCATGAAMKPLRKRFPRARVIGLDWSSQMLRRYAARGSWFSRAAAIQADARALPFADDSVDVVFSNLLLPWIDEPPALAAEVSRVLRDGGVFAFSTLGPDSFAEIRAAWGDADEHVNRFPDMHDIGDALVRAGLRDPVLDVDRLTITWKNSHDLFRDLTAAGARNSLAGRRGSLTSRQRFAAMQERLRDGQIGNEIRFELELVYGHCWGSPKRQQDAHVRIDPMDIPIRRQ